MTNLDIREEYEIREARRQSLTSLHKIGVCVSDECDSLLFEEYMVSRAFADYQITNSEVFSLVNRMLGYCYDFRDITGDESLARTANDIFDAYYNDRTTNHEIVTRTKALADRLATEAIYAWAKF